MLEETEFESYLLLFLLKLHRQWLVSLSYSPNRWCWVPLLLSVAFTVSVCVSSRPCTEQNIAECVLISFIFVWLPLCSDLWLVWSIVSGSLPLSGCCGGCVVEMSSCVRLKLKIRWRTPWRYKDCFCTCRLLWAVEMKACSITSYSVFFLTKAWLLLWIREKSYFNWIGNITAFLLWSHLIMPSLCGGVGSWNFKSGLFFWQLNNSLIEVTFYLSTLKYILKRVLSQYP